MFIIYTFRRRSLCKWTRPVQSFQVISEFADEIHRQSVIGSDGQLTNVFRIKTNDEELLFNIIVDSIDPQFLAARLCYLRKRN